MRLSVLCACALAACGAALFVGAPPTAPRPAAAGQPDKPDKVIKELQDKRIAVLKEIVEITEKTYKGGQGGFDQVARARLDLLQAQLDASRTKEERVRVLEETVKQAESLEDVAKRLVEAKQAGRVEALKAQALVLQTRIALEQARAA